MKSAEGDLHKILSLQYLAYQSEALLLNNLNIPPLKQTYEDISKEFTEQIFFKVIDECGNIVGSVRLYEKNNTYCIGKLIVHPEWQRQGIGSKILLSIETMCQSKRYELFTSSKSENNIKLYESLGYQEFKRERVSNDLEFVYMEKFCGLCDHR